MSEYENKQFEDTGFETPTTNAIVSEKSKVVAAVLAFFLGGFGIHRFYVGKIGSGLVMLVLWFIVTIHSRPKPVKWKTKEIIFCLKANQRLSGRCDLSGC